MNIERKASHVGIFGKSGKGKTTYGLRYIVGSFHDRVFIFDHQSEFAFRLKTLPVLHLGQVREMAKTERYIIYDYTKEFPGNLEYAFDAFATEVFDMATQYLEPQNIDSLFVCDEVTKCTPNAQCPQPLKNILQTGRRYNLDSCLLSQQPNRLHNEIREQLTELVLFNLVDENSLKFVKNMGKNTDEILALNDLEYKWYDLARGDERKGKLKYTKVISET